jgi:hypothetical protein
MSVRRFIPGRTGVRRDNRTRDVMASNIPRLRADLERLRIDAEQLTDIEAFHLSCALRGWQVTPRTAAHGRPIDARVWLAAALGTGGRYLAPETASHPADLRDGGLLVDSVILMAVVQRHFVSAPEPAWDDDALAAQLGLDSHDIARAQAVLSDMQAAVPRAQPPLGPGWWLRTSQAPA